MKAFEIKNKVALVTGGASGIGFQFALELLRKEAKGVTLVDVNSEVGSRAVKEIESKYGKNKAIFVKADVTNYKQFEVDTFKNIDILINNAGTMNDAEWPTSITLNLNGTIHGVLLGLETYLPKHKSGSEGLIVNISSVAGICPFAAMPIYAATKFAVHGLTLSWGLSAHYNRTKVRVVGVCPGSTVTPLLTDLPNRILSPSYEEIRKMEIDGSVLQKPEQVAPGVMQVIEKAPSGTMWVIEGGAAPYQYKLPKRDEIPKVHL